MRRWPWAGSAVVCCGLAIAAAGAAGPRAPGFVQDSTVSFARDVFPLLERSCVQCHGGTGDDGEVREEEGLNMTTYERLVLGSMYGTVVEPGNPDESLIIEMIEAGDMPKEGEPLTTAEIQTIRRWIAAGALNN